MNTNRALIIFLFFTLTYFNVAAQEHSDIGLFAGTSYYMGDLNPSQHYTTIPLAIGPIYRYNFNNYSSLRAHAFYHKLSGSDDLFLGDDGLPASNAPSFAANFVDLGLDFEFNWKAYRTAHRKTKASPYIFAGIGMGLNLSTIGFPPPGVANPDGDVSERIPPIHATIPFGFGYKINLGRWLSGGFEISSRKALTDLVDGVKNPGLPGSQENFDLMNMGAFGNRDWYFFTGFFITYKFFKFWEDCPTYDNSHKY